MEALQELVKAAVGFNSERGDSLSVRSMQFEPLPVDGTAPLAAARMAPIDIMRLAQIAILGLVALALGIFVVRPILAKPGTSPQLAPWKRPSLHAARRSLSMTMGPSAPSWPDSRSTYWR